MASEDLNIGHKSNALNFYSAVFLILEFERLSLYSLSLYGKELDEQSAKHHLLCSTDLEWHKGE